jgi:hypothetical protein
MLPGSLDPDDITRIYAVKITCPNPSTELPEWLELGYCGQRRWR